MVVRAPEYEVLLGKGSTSSHCEMSAWCTKKFGKRWCALDHREGTWCCFWAGRESPGDYRWCFRDEEDMVLFLLRWA